eukprot:1049529-Rhodomonas_salina.1
MSHTATLNALDTVCQSRAELDRVWDCPPELLERFDEWLRFGKRARSCSRNETACIALVCARVLSRWSLGLTQCGGS